MIEIKRIVGLADKFRKYSVILDGSKVAELSEGESYISEIEPGHHSLYMKIDWARSAKLEFDSSKSNHSRFVAVSGLNKGRILFVLLYMTILYSRWINLKQLK
jgi:hypothetical protein